LIRKLSFVLPVVILLTVAAFWLGAKWESTTGKHHKAPATAKKTSIPKDGIPCLDGKITEVQASPDFTLIAVQYRLANGSHSLALFDPATRKILGTIPGVGWQLEWSPDSKWLSTDRLDRSD
jgi:hypothetical protein